MDDSTLSVRAWRGREAGRFQTYAVPRLASQTVLDVVVYVQRKLDPTLAYRYACRVGMCGSCAMTVNGRPRWTCRTHVAKLGAGPLTIEPLNNLPRIKDLAADLAPFFEKWAKAVGRFVPPAESRTEFAEIPPGSKERRASDAGIECIGCAVCFSACDTVAWNRDYLGPAALNRAWTLMNDVRDAGARERLAAIAGEGGCSACHSHQSCREHCPKSLNPTAAIAGLKRLVAKAALSGDLK